MLTLADHARLFESWHQSGCRDYSVVEQVATLARLTSLEHDKIHGWLRLVIPHQTMLARDLDDAEREGMSVVELAEVLHKHLAILNGSHT